MGSIFSIFPIFISPFPNIKALREYNAELTRNSSHRQTIDHLRQERKFFDLLTRKLNNEIVELKKSTADLIEKSGQVKEGWEKEK